MPDIIIPLPEAKITDENEIVLPVIPLHQSIVFPATEVILGFGKEKSKRALEQAFTSTNRRLVIVMQKGNNNGDPKEEALEKIGVLCEVDRFLPLDQEVNALVRGLKRVRINEYVTFDPYITARVTEVEE